MKFYLNTIRKNIFNKVDDKSDNDQIDSSISEDKETSLTNLKQFMRVAPKLSEVRKSIEVMKEKEGIIYKIVLDIMGSYLRHYYG